MKYYIAERNIDLDGGRTAWTKARADAERIAAGIGYVELPVVPPEGDRQTGGLGRKLRGHIVMGRVWRAALAPLGKGDVLFLQLPAVHNSLLLASALRRARRRGTHIVALVHDLDTLRMSLVQSYSLRTRARMALEEKGILRWCDRFIVHNEKMAELMVSRGFSPEKLIPLGIFDYLMEPAAEAAVEKRTVSPNRDRLLVAGNLKPEKAGYLYDLPEGTAIELYGPFFDEKAAGSGLQHHGVFTPEELPARLEGGFGLVWDGPASDTCRGIFGEYLKVNDPHKTSLYLAAGLPVAIWDGAALAEFITASGAGFAAASVPEAAERAAAMPAEEYERLFRGAAALGARLRRGEFLKAALEAAEGRL